MNVNVITRENISEYYSLDPLGLLERLEMPGYVAFGVTKRKIGQKKVPIGLAMYTEQDNTIILEWLYVAEEYRGRGIGEHLLSLLFEIAVSKHILLVGAFLPYTEDRNKLCAGIEGYLSERYFYSNITVPGEWEAPLLMLGSSPVIKTKVPSDKRIGRVMPLKDLSTAQIRSLFKMLDNNDKAYKLYPLSEKQSIIDMDVSYVCLDDKQLYGAFLYQKVGVDLYSVSIFARKKSIACDLLQNSYEASKKKYTLDTLSHAVFKQEIYEDLMKELYKKNAGGCILLADVAWYLKDSDDDELTFDFVDALVGTLNAEKKNCKPFGAASMAPKVYSKNESGASPTGSGSSHSGGRASTEEDEVVVHGKKVIENEIKELKNKQINEGNLGDNPFVKL